VENNTNYWDSGLVGNWSFATGYNTVARGNVSTTFGLYSKAFGNVSTAFGWGVEANDFATFACGTFNEIAYGSTDIFYPTEQIFVIGNGTGYSDRKNALTVLKNGNVGIGVSNPSLNTDEKVDIKGRLRIRSTTSTAGVWFNNSTNNIASANGAFYGMKADTETGIWINDAWRFWVNSVGNATLLGTLTQSSDKRLKKDFTSLTHSLSNIYQLQGYHYKWIEASRSQDLQTGLIAQEVQKIFPELVQTDEKGFLSVNYIGLIPHLIEAVKELRHENKDLKNINQKLENRLEKIEALLSASNPLTRK
jgi:hypothetical protein